MKRGDRKACPSLYRYRMQPAIPAPIVVSGPGSLAREPLTALVTLQHSLWGRIYYASFNRPDDIPSLNSRSCALNRLSIMLDGRQE